MACRAATSSFDRAATTLAVGRTPQGDRRFPCWRRATPRGRPETTPARRPGLPRQPGSRTPRNLNSNTRPISFDRSFGPPSGAKTTPLWRDYVRARELVQRKLKPCLTVGRGEKGVFLQRRWIAGLAPRGFGERRRPTRRRRLRYQERYARKHHDARAPNRSPGAGRSCTTSRRKRNSAAGRPPVAVEVSPVGSTRAAVSTKRRKFCLCRWRPEIPSTVRCSSGRGHSRAI